MAAPQGKNGITRRKRGFERASGLLESRIRKAGESRGFAVSRLLTHWPDVVGPELAAMARPVEVSYGRGFGATLTLLTTGAQAPLLEMQKEAVRERVNACYGYAAISRVRVTQTAATGFADGKVAFEHAPKAPAPVPRTSQKAKVLANDVTDPDLRMALEKLGSSILPETKPS